MNKVALIDGRKPCSACRELKPLEAFNRQPSGPFGRTSRCRECLRANRDPVKNRAHAKRWAQQNPDRVRENIRRWNRENADHVRRSQQRRYYLNYDRIRAQQEEWIRAHPGARADYSRRRRAREFNTATSMLGGHSTAYMRHVQAELLTGRCFYCGGSDRLTIDHVVPLSRGGLHHPENLVAACFPCNRSKSNLLLCEWKRPEPLALAA